MGANQYMTDHIWGPEIDFTYRCQFHEMILLNKAYAMMLAKQGLMTPGDCRKIAAGLDEVEAGLRPENMDREQDLYYNMMEQLSQTVGRETGSLLHMGRSRNDMMFTTGRMQIRRQLLDFMGNVHALMETLLLTAKANTDTVITYFTYGQPSQPGTYGHYLMLMFGHLSRDWVRLQAAYKNCNRSPMGAAAGIGTCFNVDKRYIAGLLGFDSTIEHSLEAVSAVDFLLEAESAMEILMLNIGKMAQDLYGWASYEYGVLDCDSSITSGSSIMPQKKNPELIEHIRAQSGKAFGVFADACMLMHNTSLFPNIEAITDIFYDYALWIREAEKAVSLLREGLAHSRIRNKRSYAYTENSFTGAGFMAEMLARKYGIPFTLTHHIVHDMIIELAEKQTLSPAYMTGALMKKTSEKILGKPLLLSDDEVRSLLDPETCLNHIATGGSPRPADTLALIAEGERILDSQRQWRDERRKQIAEAYARIQRGV